MNNRYYIVIFVVIVAMVAGFIWYNATTIDEINPEMTTGGKTSSTDQGGAVVEQKDINVLTDTDIEEDMLDLDGSEDLSDLDEMDDLVIEEEVAF